MSMQYDLVLALNTLKYLKKQAGWNKTILREKLDKNDCVTRYAIHSFSQFNIDILIKSPTHF